jgi:hypothetical protein
MKKHIKIYSILLAMMSAVLLYSCAAKNDESDAKNAAPLAEKMSMDSIAIGEQSPAVEDLGLEADELDEEQLEAFVQRAEQKLKDYSDYVAIISDKSYDTEFRKEAMKQALDLFGDTTSAAVIEYPYIDSLYVRGEKTQYRFAEVGVAEFPQRVNDKLYTGRLTFRMTRNNELPADHGHQAMIIIKKVIKTFGNETKEVWEVKIGVIRGTGS